MPCWKASGASLYLHPSHASSLSAAAHSEAWHSLSACSDRKLVLSTVPQVSSSSMHACITRDMNAVATTHIAAKQCQVWGQLDIPACRHIRRNPAGMPQRLRRRATHDYVGWTPAAPGTAALPTYSTPATSHRLGSDLGIPANRALCV